MGELSLSKSGLQKERNQFKLYKKVLPSLDLKRQQLTAEHNKAKEALVHIQRELEDVKARSAQQLPMLALEDIPLSGLVELDAADIGQENVVGVKLPIVNEVRCTVRDYSLLAKPHWVDVLVECLKKTIEVHICIQVAEQRVQVLGQAMRRITQRVNLFEKVLIPTAKKNMQRIQIFLGDTERTSVVRSKLAKKKGG